MSPYYQAGDLLLKECDIIPHDAERQADLVLLRSVDRDNAHRFADGSAALVMKHGETLYVDVGEPSELVHDEHKTILVKPGYYVMDRVREFDPSSEETRRVVD